MQHGWVIYEHTDASPCPSCLYASVPPILQHDQPSLSWTRFPFVPYRVSKPVLSCLRTLGNVPPSSWYSSDPLSCQPFPVVLHWVIDGLIPPREHLLVRRGSLSILTWEGLLVRRARFTLNLLQGPGWSLQQGITQPRVDLAKGEKLQEESR